MSYLTSFETLRLFTCAHIWRLSSIVRFLPEHVVVVQSSVQSPALQHTESICGTSGNGGGWIRQPQLIE
jgi:hypothetical protein